MKELDISCLMKEKYEIDWEGEGNKDNKNEGAGHFMFNEGKI